MKRMTRRKIKEITKAMFSEEMERMGFQVYRGGFWFRIHDGLASVFGVRRTPLGLWRVCFDVQPLIFPLYHFDSSWTGGCLSESSFRNYPHEDDFGKAWEQYFFPEVKLAPDGSLIALDDEQLSLQRLKDELWRAYVEYIKPYFDRCVDEKSCLEAAEQYDHTPYAYRDMHLIWHAKYNRWEEGIHRVQEEMTLLWKTACVNTLANKGETLLKFFKNNCDDEDDAKGIICCGYSQGKAASGLSHLEFKQIFEWWFCIYEKCQKLKKKYEIWYSEENEMFLANNDRLSKAFYKLFPEVKGEYSTQEKKKLIFYIQTVMSGYFSEKYLKYLQVLQTRDLSYCKELARKCFIDNLEYLHRTWPKRKQDVLPKEADFELLWNNGLQE